MTTLIVRGETALDHRVYCDGSMMLRESISAERYALGRHVPNYPVPAIRYEVQYQLDDGDYWCAVYDTHKLDTNHDEPLCFLVQGIRHRG